MCLSKEEVASIQALETTVQETVELAQALYDSVKPPGNTTSATESPAFKAALRPSQIPVFAPEIVGRVHVKA